MPVFLKNIRNLKLFDISIILLFWILLFASPLLWGKTDGVIAWNNVFRLWIEHSILLVLFLINRFILLPFVLFRNKLVIYVISAFFLIAVAVSGLYLNNRTRAPSNERRPAAAPLTENRYQEAPGKPPPPRRNPDPATGSPSRPEPIPAYINLLILSVLVFGFDTGLKMTSKWMQSEQLRMNLEKENVETQLAYLKYQISPHFFMNTLNNIHALIDVDSTEAKKSIIKLSNLMRHLLYESDHELGPLKNEIEFVRSYVDLMKLRYSSGVKITLNIPDNIPDKSIPPLLFISLIENAFKHGISYLQESFINIELNFLPDELHLKITNSKNRGRKKSSDTGIGIENTRKRLDLLFKEKYTLDITDRGNVFITNLIIPI